MGQLDSAASTIRAKIVYFGAAGSGTTANLRWIERKLRREHRGERERHAAWEDPNAYYELLPVSLGVVRDYETSIQILTVPSGDTCAATRRRLLEDADGVVLVADTRPPSHARTLAALAELRGHLQAHGRSFSDIVLVVQYNFRDLATENALDALHRNLGVEPAASFEAVAREGTGVLQTLTTAAKLVLTKIRREALGASRSGARRAGEAGARREPARGAEPGEKGFRIESAGPVEGVDDELRVPVVLVDSASGRRVELTLRLSLDVP